MSRPRNIAWALALAVGLTLFPATPAAAHIVEACNWQAHHGGTNPAKVKVKARINDPDTGPYANGYSGTDNDDIWTTCFGTPDGTSETTDVYIAAYTDKLVSGTYYNCASKVMGWRGTDAGPGWWIANIPTAKLMNDCSFGTRPVRVRALGKGQWVDGHVLSLWTYTSAHPAI